MNRKLIVATVAALFASTTMAAHVEVGAGLTDYSHQPDSVWYQAGNPHRLELNGRAWMIGLTGNAWHADDFGIDWHADYLNLGHLRSSCNCTPIDDAYSIKLGRMIRDPGVPNSLFSGHGNAQGLLLALSPYFERNGYRLSVTAGAFAYRPEWRETVYGWTVVPGRAGVTEHLAMPNRMQIGEMFGIGIQHKRVSLQYEFIRLPTRFDAQHVPALYTAAHVVMLTYQL